MHRILTPAVITAAVFAHVLPGLAAAAAAVLLARFAVRLAAADRPDAYAVAFCGTAAIIAVAASVFLTTWGFATLRRKLRTPTPPNETGT